METVAVERLWCYLGREGSDLPEAEQTLGTTLVTTHDLRLGGKVTSSLRGLLLENVILEWTPAHDLSGTGDLEPLRRAPV